MGIAATAFFLGLLAYVANKRQSEQAAVPALAIMAPIAGSAADSPLVITFSSTKPIELTPKGWGAAGLHLHAWVNDVQYMPAASEIKKINGSQYQWALPLIGRGPLVVRLGWADVRHRPIAAGSTPDVPLTLQ